MKAIFLGLFLTSIGWTASAAEYAELRTYKGFATTLLGETRSARSPGEIAHLQQGLRQLANEGVEIAALYSQKNPSCAEQLEAMTKEFSQMEAMSVKAQHDRYHDGKGLPEAPRHCYYGRSVVTHPMMSVTRLATGLSDRDRAQIAHEVEEVIEHIPKIQKNLDNPPN